MKKATSAVVSLVIIFCSSVAQAQFETRIQGIPQAAVVPSPNVLAPANPQGQVPIWRYGKPVVAAPPQSFQSIPSAEPRLGGRVTSVYSPPTQRVLPVDANRFNGNSIIPLRVAPPQSPNGGFVAYPPVAASPRWLSSQRGSSSQSGYSSLRRPLTNVYRPPSSQFAGGSSWVSPAPAPVASQVKVAGAVDATQLEAVAGAGEMAGGGEVAGTRLRLPASATSQFVFELDGVSYKINPGASVNLPADKERSLRFPAGPGLGDRVATLKPNESYAFDFRGEEGWVLIPDLQNSPQANPVLPETK